MNGLRRMAFLSCLALSACVGSAEKTPDEPTWAWEVVRSGAPNFEGKNNDDLIVIDVKFRNELLTDQTLVVSQSAFIARELDGSPVEVVGLLFNPRGSGGSKGMTSKGDPETTEVLFHVGGMSRLPFLKTYGPVEVMVGGQRSYVQSLILARPPEQTAVRLRFGALPELEIGLPDGRPAQ
jgi:hypothetical protein